MQLIKATKKNGVFAQLETQWQGQLAKYGEALEDYILPFREHCKSVINADHSNYFVYVLEDGGAYEGFAHINHARIKHFEGKTLRALEIYLAPIYDFEDVAPQKSTELVAGLVTNILKLSDKEHKSQNIKIHIRALDKPYITAFSNIYGEKMGISMSIEGSWLVMKK